MLGQAALAMWWDVASDMRDEFEHWHTHEHFPERLALPGFQRASRWHDAAGGDGFFVLYDLAAYDALASPEYLARLNAPTPWSGRLMPHHRHMVRSPCHVADSRGAVVAAAMLTVRLSPAAGQAPRLRSHLQALLRRLPGEPGLAGAHLLLTDTAAIATTTEHGLRGHADRAADWIVLVAGYDLDVLRHLAQQEFAPARLAQAGSAADAVFGHYLLRASALRVEACAPAEPPVG